ncbi:hypothetical protein LOTGIDRAFT_114823 [Lottia gigantea]|uniref:Receptor ligand binding region domain-containing protein n=1 Tax=Lottia gigantea TaxID=225164 RepID=V4C6H8_LOTGI|nr:hypothetical protein LOTGIDRAFT_114823 [Lottia gigantea]ESO97269.1 hypothetical protein LOTGIDRAFT_114823 [Lottia gigantea]
MAFFWAINHYKSIAGSEVDIGGVAFDNCGRHEQAIENVLSFAQCKLRPDGVERRQLLAYVGPDRSSEAMALGRTMTDLNITYISHSATSPDLRDSKRIPYFLRTVPSDANDALIMAQMVTRIGTKYVMIVYMDDAYGRAGREQFTAEIQREDKCVVQAVRLPINPTPAEIQEVTNMLIAKQVVKYVALYTDAAHARV